MMEPTLFLAIRGRSRASLSALARLFLLPTPSWSTCSVHRVEACRQALPLRCRLPLHPSDLATATAVGGHEPNSTLASDTTMVVLARTEKAVGIVLAAPVAVASTVELAVVLHVLLRTSSLQLCLLVALLLLAALPVLLLLQAASLLPPWMLLLAVLLQAPLLLQVSLSTFRCHAAPYPIAAAVSRPAPRWFSPMRS